MSVLSIDIIIHIIWTFPIVVIFPWLCVWGGFTIICCQLYIYIYMCVCVCVCVCACAYIYIYPCRAGFCAFSYCAVLWFAQIIDHFMDCWSYTIICTLLYLIITIAKILICYKACTIYFVSSVCLRLLQLSCQLLQLSQLCISSLPISVVMILRIPV